MEKRRVVDNVETMPDRIFDIKNLDRKKKLCNFDMRKNTHEKS